MKKALLLLNMGGINSIDEVELFLKNMFDDRYILPMPKPIRKMVARKIINSRLQEVKQNYQLLGGKSPLTDISKSLASKLEKELNMPVYLAMRYVPPFAKDALLKCKEQGVEELLLFSMYPQYSTTTTKSSLQDIYDICQEINYKPKFSVVESYYDDFGYIKLVGDDIIKVLKDKDSQEYTLILSAHGLPQSIIKKGDSYQNHIYATVGAIKSYLGCKGVEFANIELAYQSKVGNAKWLEPNLQDVIKNNPNKKAIIYPIAFTIDNSETVFELDIEHREIAQKAGYEDFVVVNALNDSDDFVKFIAKRLECANNK
jgi:ferrochelatase